MAAPIITPRIRPLVLLFHIVNTRGLNEYLFEFCDHSGPLLAYLFPRKWFRCASTLQQTMWRAFQTEIIDNVQCLKAFKRCFGSGKQCDKFFRREWNTDDEYDTPSNRILRDKMTLNHMFAINYIMRILRDTVFRKCTCHEFWPKAMKVQMRSYKYTISQISHSADGELMFQHRKNRATFNVKVSYDELIGVITECLFHSCVTVNNGELHVISHRKIVVGKQYIYLNE